jgi:hypothetical protein
MATALAYAYMGEDNPNREGTVLAFILLFTVFYGPGKISSGLADWL